ncbi:MAG: sigma-70 family RNA polymerase sigma factor [Verrucomicrobiota bacterium]|jgi:RNA polymerase sigma-70 factor (ECF subfamily)|nr:RNA polymerase subunit sigma-24 [Verrucomicrobiales bacterium]MED6313650.1 sigma-70 family RNA polymerase sigma factor [Verrucomicrobiota bacterium]|tara:strand:+ start:440 stop:1051 length:612 start_codon:yes stop_codon:yes gene_type:complete
MQVTETAHETDIRTDEELVALVVDGNVDCFEVLIIRYQTRVFGMARKYFRNESDVEDIVQTIFTKTFQRLASYKGTAPFEHWFMRLSINTCYDALRRHRNRPEQTISDMLFDSESWEDRLSNIPDSDDPKALNQARELVHTVLDQISDRARIVLTMQELEGRSIREIAGITGWSESLVKVQAFRARKEMRQAVERFLMKEKRL